MKNEALPDIIGVFFSRVLALAGFLSSHAEGPAERSQYLGAFARVQVVVRACVGRDASKSLAINDPELLGCWQDPGRHKAAPYAPATEC